MPPPSDSAAFYGDDNVTVYYLPGTTGWATFCRSASDRAVEPASADQRCHLGVQTNGFGFTITGSSNLVIVVEACTNLANPIWSPVGHEHPHRRLVLFQRPAVDELSRPFLPPALAVRVTAEPNKCPPRRKCGISLNVARVLNTRYG